MWQIQYCAHIQKFSIQCLLIWPHQQKAIKNPKAALRTPLYPLFNENWTQLHDDQKFARRRHDFSTFNRLHVSCATFRFELKTLDLRIVNALNADAENPFWQHIGIMTKSTRKGRMHSDLKQVQWYNNSEKACAVGHVANGVCVPRPTLTPETAWLMSHRTGNRVSAHTRSRNAHRDFLHPLT